SGVILALNEEAALGKAIRCARLLCQQVIVVDNESDDRTLELARRCADVVLSAPRSLRFDAARNLAIPHVTGDWVWINDCDERLSPELVSVVRPLLRERGHDVDAAWFPFKS